MAKPKVGKSAKDIFAPTAASKATTPTTKRTSTAPPAKDYAKVTVCLRHDQVAYLDRLAADMRAAGAVLKRAEIVRALIDAMQAGKVDLADVTSEADLAERLKVKM